MKRKNYSKPRAYDYDRGTTVGAPRTYHNVTLLFNGLRRVDREEYTLYGGDVNPLTASVEKVDKNVNFSIEISEIDLALAPESPKIGRLSAVPVYIDVRDVNSGKTITFKFHRKDTSEDGDIHGWYYSAFKGHTKHCTLLIIND